MGHFSVKITGFPGSLLSGNQQRTLRLNATAFNYVYKNLQVQQFDASVIQIRTFNAGELTTRGVEADMLWKTPVEGLTLRGAVAYTNTKYTGKFVNLDGEDMDGEKGERNAEWTGFVGGTYKRPLSGNVMIALDSDLRYSDGYSLAPFKNSLRQDSYWLLDASLRLYTSDSRFEVALIGKNLTDEIVAYEAQARPFACAPDPGGMLPCNPAPKQVALDQTVATSLGRQLTLQFTYRF